MIRPITSGLRRITAYLFVLMCLALLPSCGDDDAMDEITAAPRWERDMHFVQGRATQMNSRTVGDRLLVLGNQFTSIVADSLEHPDGSPRQRAVTYGINTYEQQINRRMPIGEDFFAVYAPGSFGYLRFFANANPVLERTEQSFFISKSDSSYSAFDLANYIQGECMAIESNRLLVPYIAEVKARPQLHLALVTVPVDRDYVYGVQLGTPTAKILTVDQDQYGPAGFFFAHRGYFFFSAYRSSYRVDSSGVMEEVFTGGGFTSYTTVGDALYAISGRGIHKSLDDGASWVQVVENSDLTFFKFATIDGRSVAFVRDQVTEFKIDDSGYSFTELDNLGLEGSAITSASAFDGKVYLTTLSGVYRKPLESFFDVKEE